MAQELSIYALHSMGKGSKVKCKYGRIWTKKVRHRKVDVWVHGDWRLPTEALAAAYGPILGLTP